MIDSINLFTSPIPNSLTTESSHTYYNQSKISILSGDETMKLYDKPTLTLFCGLPGSGKTTLAKKLEQEKRGIRICTDDWQECLGIDHHDEAFHDKL